MMTIKQIHDLAIEMGRKTDFRDKTEIDYLLDQQKKRYEKLTGRRKELFDKELLTNPYTDSRLLYGDPNRQVKRVLVGIDMEAPEVLLASDLGKDFNKKIDLVIGHHPEGKCLADLGGVMHLQADLMHHYGVPINVAESVLHSRIEEVHRGISPLNHNRAIDAARALDIPYMNTHTVTDNLAARFLETHINKAKPRSVGELLESLYDLEEYCVAEQTGSGPMIFAGKSDNRCGKIALTEITGGTEGSTDMYEALAHAGVGTIVGMHQSERHRDSAQKARLNIVIAGHMSSDSLGMNLFLDELEKRGIEIVPVSGLIRVSRAKKSASAKKAPAKKAKSNKSKKSR